ncbi:STM4015 family protein [Actinomadura sp. 7K507]|uniref:STM4015 family protein n=1 Tax=Actinomadura sp. 7K507 TaxID=2530365 RepID=UPI00104530AC|nr:STM4015 family protein [Actinomadura sp. 7K507]TDC82248.1 leucine-rich repeat domain-containing protein [Actinomadura sp. 7K507]
MSVHEHLTVYDGKPVVDFIAEPEMLEDDFLVDFLEQGEVPEFCATGADVPGSAWRIHTTYQGPPFEELFTLFLGTVDTSQVTRLLVGFNGAAYEYDRADPVRLLVDAADRLPDLESLFLGDIVAEEVEISWIPQSDVTPLFAAFPGLRRLDVRGGDGLSLSPVRSEALRTLRFETGGLPREVVQALGESELPSLEHLDLWLGSAAYGGDARIADLEPILNGGRLTSLTHLGLEDSEIQDEVAAAVAEAPVVARLRTLSLAMGLLTDTGAEALLSGQPLTHLERLDLHHHFLSAAMMGRLEAALPDVEVNLDSAKDPGEELRYIAAAE